MEIRLIRIDNITICFQLLQVLVQPKHTIEKAIQKGRTEPISTHILCSKTSGTTDKFMYSACFKVNKTFCAAILNHMSIFFKYLNSFIDPQRGQFESTK